MGFVQSAWRWWLARFRQRGLPFLGLSLVGLCCVCSLPVAMMRSAGESAGLLPTRTLVPSQTPIPSATPRATRAPRATDAPAATAEPTPNVETIVAQLPTRPPTAVVARPTPPSAAVRQPTTVVVDPFDTAHYEQVAREAAQPLDTREAVGLPPGEWSVLIIQAGDISVRYPMTAGLNNEQTVRQGGRQIAAIVRALFLDDKNLTQVNVIGTLPLGANEAAAISVVLTRAEFLRWDGVGANLPLQISPRLR